LIARGRDAADVAISTSFGFNTLQEFEVTTYELPDTPLAAVAPRMQRRWYGVKAADERQSI
jgi:hypothetical protein